MSYNNHLELIRGVTQEASIAAAREGHANATAINLAAADRPTDAWVAEVHAWNMRRNSALARIPLAEERAGAIALAKRSYEEAFQPCNPKDYSSR